MTNQERHKFALIFIEDAINILEQKGTEYEVNGDVNGNFKRVAKEQDLTNFQIWNTFFQKHLDSIRNYIKNPKMELTEPIEGRIIDAINYLIILASLIEEERK